MKQTIIISILLILFSATQAQETKSFQDVFHRERNPLALKVSWGMAYENWNGLRDHARDRRITSKIPDLSLVRFNGENRFTELNLFMDFNFTHQSNLNQQNDSLAFLGRKTNVEMGLLVSHHFDLRKDKSKVFHPTLGLGTGLVYTMDQSIPTASNSFPIDFRSVLMPFELIPGARFLFKNNLFVDVTLPIRLAQIEIEGVINQDPSIPFQQQTVNTISFDMIPGRMIQLKFGLGFLL